MPQSVLLVLGRRDHDHEWSVRWMIGVKDVGSSFGTQRTYPAAHGFDAETARWGNEHTTEVFHWASCVRKWKEVQRTNRPLASSAASAESRL